MEFGGAITITFPEFPGQMVSFLAALPIPPFPTNTLNPLQTNTLRAIPSKIPAYEQNKPKPRTYLKVD